MANLLQDWLLDPTALLFFASLITITVLFRTGRRSRGGELRRHGGYLVLVVFWLALFLVASAPTVVNPLLATLEDRYPVGGICESGSHLVMLGGGVDSRVASADEFERMSPATIARASAAARIANDEPGLRLIAAGGALRVITEADVVANYWQALGIDESRILREGSSSNTHENAVNVGQILARENVEGPVRLVSSALHMPRAVETFNRVLEEQGLKVCPVSVDRLAIDNVARFAWMPQTTALEKFDKWLHEILALVVYRLRGWI